MAALLDFEKLPSDTNYGVWHGPSGGSTLGVTNVNEPLAAELNNTGGTSGVINVSPSISWNDWAFGTQASETLNEPSFADAASYTEFGQNNYGGAISYFRPLLYDDNSNLHSLVYDLTDDIDSRIDVACRLDGETAATSVAVDGDFVSVYRVEHGAESNPFTPGESKRRTVTWLQKSEFSHYTVVGEHTITAIPPDAFAPGDTGRIRASQQDRDTTNRLRFTTSNAAVIAVYPGGFFEVTGADTTTATVTITDPGTGDSETVAVSVEA